MCWKESEHWVVIFILHFFGNRRVTYHIGFIWPVSLKYLYGTSLRNQILSRYPAFVRQLLQSPSKEVRVLARLVSSDPRSTTCSNLKYLQEMTGLTHPQYFSSARVKVELPTKLVPGSERWRIGLLDNLLKLKMERFLKVEDSKAICAMIDSLCSTW